MFVKQRIAGLICALLALVWLPSAAHAEPPDRSGFTIEAHLGISNVTDTAPSGGSDSGIGVSPLGLGLGGFITPDFALMARMTGASMFAKVNDSDEQLGLNFYGFAGQYWPTDQVMLSAGAGATIYSPNPLSTNLSDAAVEGLTRTGWGASLRAGYSFGVWQHHSLRASAEFLPSVLDDTFVLGSSIILEYQYY